jgi:hypothetical protein
MWRVSQCCFEADDAERSVRQHWQLEPANSNTDGRVESLQPSETAGRDWNHSRPARLQSANVSDRILYDPHVSALGIASGNSGPGSRPTAHILWRVTCSKCSPYIRTSLTCQHLCYSDPEACLRHSVHQCLLFNRLSNQGYWKNRPSQQLFQVYLYLFCRYIFRLSLAIFKRNTQYFREVTSHNGSVVLCYRPYLYMFWQILPSSV